MQTESVPMTLVAEVNELNFDAEVLKHRGPVLVDFSTAWCGPCRALTPIVHELAREQAGSLKVVAIDGDSAPNLAARYGVRGFPTLILFRAGEEITRRLGLTTKQKLLEMLAVVWALEDYKNLGDATSAHFLDQPGLPEVPGASQH